MREAFAVLLWGLRPHARRGGVAPPTHLLSSRSTSARRNRRRPRACAGSGFGSRHHAAFLVAGRAAACNNLEALRIRRAGVRRLFRPWSRCRRAGCSCGGVSCPYSALFFSRVARLDCATGTYALVLPTLLTNSYQTSVLQPLARKFFARALPVRRVIHARRHFKRF